MALPVREVRLLLRVVVLLVRVAVALDLSHVLSCDPFSFHVIPSRVISRQVLSCYVVVWQKGGVRLFERGVADFKGRCAGVQPPLGYWDPAGLASDGDAREFYRRRVVEIKHGRVAMLACRAPKGVRA